MAHVVRERLPEIATTIRTVGSRGGRVYVDSLQNGHGRRLVGPYSVRPVPGASVSTPLRWSEVDASLDPSAFTIRTLPGRLARMKDDPLLPVLDEVPDLGRALTRLSDQLRG